MTHRDSRSGAAGAPPAQTSTHPAATAAPPPVAGARYTALFDALRVGRQGAFVPFFVLGDPDIETSARLLGAAVRAGADALEVGIPFSDPIADGPTVQRATLRAAAAGATPAACFELLSSFRDAHPQVPVGLLTYANLVVGDGLDTFYERAAQAGIDSVLVADVPLLEAEPFSRAARARGIAPILLAPPNLPSARIPRLRDMSDGYTYCVARRGVTGVDPAGASGLDARLSATGLPALFEALRAAGAPPPLVGFGVSEPDHVRAFLRAGAAGAISGSAVAALIEGKSTDPAGAVAAVAAFVRRMKEATSLA